MKIYEIIILVLIFTLIGYKGIGSLYDHKINHEHPYGYSAADAFQHYARVLGAHQDQNYIYTSPTLVAGETNISGHFSPISVISPGHISYLSKIQPYDTMLLNVGIIFALIALFVYFLIKKVNKNIAFLALPLTLLIVTGKHFSPISWGIMGFVYGYFFFLLFCWSLPYLFKEGYGFVFIGITAAGIIMAHGNQIVFAGFIAGLYILSYILKIRKIDKTFIKRIIIIAAIVVILAGYSFLLQFLSCRGGGMALYTPGKPILNIWNIPNVLLSDFAWWILGISVIGAVGLLFLNINYFIIFLGLFSLGFLNYIGIAYPAFQQRFFWPVALSIFFGAGIYVLLFIRELKKYAVVLSLALIILFGFIYQGQEPTIGIMDDLHWDAFQQIKFNTPSDSEILIPGLYPYTQASIKYLLEKMPYENRDFDLMYEWALKLINNQSVDNRTIYTSIGTENTCRFPTRTGFLNIGWNNVSIAYLHPREFCSFDYYVVDKVLYSQEDEITLKSLHVIYKKMYEKEWIDVFYENEMTVILWNKDKTRDCING